jgi:hypothetical protein
LSPVYGDPEEPDRLNQGDIFEEVPFVGFDARDPARFLTSLGIVTAHDCECDKFFAERGRGFSEEIEATWPIVVAPVYPLADLDEDQGGNARAGRIYRYFYLPQEGDMDELVVDLDREQAVPAVTLLNLERRACLSEETQLKLYVHLWVLRTRLKPEDVFKTDLTG